MPEEPDFGPRADRADAGGPAPPLGRMADLLADKALLLLAVGSVLGALRIRSGKAWATPSCSRR